MVRGVGLAAWVCVSIFAAASSLRAADSPLSTAEFLSREVAALSAIPSRMSGTAGCEQAASYVKKRFRELGLKRITEQPFDVVVPITKYSRMSLGVAGDPVEIHPLWPNWVRTCTTPGPLTGPIVYVGKGDLRRLKGLPLTGSILLMEFNTAATWQVLAQFGPKAFVFVEPDGELAHRRHAELKFVNDPVNMPRFWVPAAGAKLGARALVSRVRRAQEAGTPLTASVDCRVDWERREAKNIFGFLEGTEGTLESGPFLAFAAHYDSMSIAPDRSPGADATGSLAGLLRLAEFLVRNRPADGTMFVATAGHYQALRGATVLADAVRLSSSMLREGGRSQIDGLRRRVEKLSARVFPWENLGAECDALTKQIESADELDDELRAELLKEVAALKQRAGKMSAPDAVGSGSDPGKSFGAAAKAVAADLKPHFDALIALLRGDPLCERIRELEEDRIDRAGRIEAYEENIADRIRSTAGLAPASAERALKEVARLKVEVTAATAPEAAYERLLGVIGGAADEGIIGEELAKRLRAEARAGQRALRGERAFTAQSTLADYLKPVEALESDLRNTLSVARGMLDQVEILKREVTTKTSSYRAYERLYGLLRRATAPGAAARRRVKFAAEHEEDSDRHMTMHRFELLRLRRHRAFLDDLGIDLNKRLRLFFSLELSGDGQRFGVFGTGKFLEHKLSTQVIYGGLMQRIWQIGRKRLEEEPTKPGQEARQYERVIYPERESERLGGYFNGAVAFDSEVIQLAGREALAFATVDAGRRRVDTPCDTVEALKQAGGLGRLAYQVDVLAELIGKMSADSSVQTFFKSLDQKRLSEKSVLQDHLCRVYGQVVLYDQRQSIATADVPVPGALCVSRLSRRHVHGSDKGAVTCSGVRSGWKTFADQGGNFELLGVPHDKSRVYGMTGFWFSGYKFNSESDVAAARADGRSVELGEVSHAPDLGPQGEKQFPLMHRVAKPDFEVTIPVFRCRPVALFGYVDALVSRDYRTITLYDAKTNTTPDFYGHSNYSRSPAYTEGFPSMVLFLQDKVRFKLQFRAGVVGSNVPLLKMRPDKQGETVLLAKDGEARGHGYGPEDVVHGVLPNCRFLMARDVTRLDEFRIRALDDHAVSNQRVNELHYGKKEEGQVVSPGAVQLLDKAESALAEKDYSRYLVNVEGAFARESRAYPIVKGTTTDILTGVLFYLFLLLPFSYFTERLLFGFPSINKRIAGFFGVFVTVFIILALVHPAFAITQSAPVILIAFITLALSLLVIMVIRGRFELEVRRLHERPGARRQADFRRASATSAACSLGIGNMRRRKVRTTLTVATLVLLTFSVLSFTSVDPRQITHENRNPTGEEINPPYSGVLLRDFRYMAVHRYLYDLALNEFSGEADVIPRATYSVDVRLENAADFRKDFLCPGVLGLTPEEVKATRVHDCLQPGSRWFRADDAVPGAIIGKQVAETLGISLDQVVKGNQNPRLAPRIRMLGVDLPIIGLLDDGKFKNLKGIDGEELSPIDRRKERWEKRSGKSFDPYSVETYEHVEAENCVLIPFGLMMDIGGKLTSVAIVPHGQETEPEKASERAAAIGEDLLSRLTIPIYIASKPDNAVRYVVSSDANTVRGLGAMIVPMLICALIVLNTMLGSVYERQREISIFGSLGLAPLHIGSLFVAESAVFATIAVILGYVLGQITSFILSNTALLEGFSLNYSSTSAVISAAAVMALVLLSTIYPARKASQLSVPDVERIWKLPPPEGDEFYIKFPFTIGGDQAYGINMFLLEYFRDHANQSIGDFFAQDTDLTFESIDGREVMRFDSQVWIAPFDFGISQMLWLYTMPTDEEGIYAPEMRIIRKSGAPAAWARMNHRFLKLIRQQFLMWRILSGEEREVFAAQAKVHLGIATDADRRLLEEVLARKPVDEEDAAGSGEAERTGEEK